MIRIKFASRWVQFYCYRGCFDPMFGSQRVTQYIEIDINGQMWSHGNWGCKWADTWLTLDNILNRADWVKLSKRPRMVHE